MNPQYRHDCQKCLFLGRFADTDIYTCPAWHGTTYLVRSGDDAGDYASREDFGDSERATVTRDTAGLTEAQAALMVCFRLLPCALLNIHARANRA